MSAGFRFLQWFRVNPWLISFLSGWLVLALWGSPSLLAPNGEALAQTDVPKAIRLELPPGLARYRSQQSQGDFFTDIQPLLPDGSYAQWVDYPVPVYIQSDHAEWAKFVGQAVKEWSAYIPLKVVSTPEQADAGISITRVGPLAGASGAAKPEFFFGQEGSLQHRVQIVIGEYQGLAEVTTVARHEIGHALGLWGHSPNLRDLMYGGNHAEATGGSRVLRVAKIGPRELNTLKRVYEQPTLMGQVIPENLR